jgi:glycosyltransferase involved in cell wall biosynthesis
MGGGGAERQLTYLAQGGAQSGCEIHVALNHGGPNLDALAAAGAVIHRLSVRRNHDPRMLSRLVAVITAVKPDVIQCWLLQMEIAGGAAAVVTRTPWVLSERSSVDAYPPGLKTRFRIGIASLASAIVSNSPAGDRYWGARTRGTVPRYVVPNALPFDEIAAVPVATDEEVGLQPGEAFVLFAGRLDPSKNADALVPALRSVSSSRPLRAIFCGDGPSRDRIEALLVAHGLVSRVRLTGYTSNLRSLMKRASVLVSPSRFEGSPNVVLEAMACGCPLVVSDIEAHHDLLDDRSAILVNTDEPSAIARGIEAVLADPIAADRRASVACSRAERHALPLIAAQYAAVYRDVLSRRAPLNEVAV